LLKSTPDSCLARISGVSQLTPPAFFALSFLGWRGQS
jgi:hypothetical protein